MAYFGALLGSLGPDLVEGGGEGPPDRPAVGQALERAERSLIERHDEIVSGLVERLQAEGPLDASPGTVRRRVWELLFPEVPAGLSLPELVRTLHGSGVA